MNKSIGLSLIICVISLSLSLAQELCIFRLSEKVGDIIDSVEREQYNLFPGLSNFEFARILTKNDSSYYTDITFRYKDSLVHFYIKLTPRELERMIFCIEYSERIKDQISQNEYALLAYNRFWDQIETRQVSCLGGDDLGDDDSGLLFSDAEISLGILHGTTIGSAIGGCVGSVLGIKKISQGYGAGCEDCGSGSVYRVNHLIFWTAAGIGTSAGAIVGCKLGKRSARNNLMEFSGPNEEKFWRIGCAVASTIPGLALGLATFIFASGFHYGKMDNGSIENDPHYLTIIPGIITGLGVTIEIIYWGYTIGRSIDRKNAKTVMKKQNSNQKFCDSEKK